MLPNTIKEELCAEYGVILHTNGENKGVWQRWDEVLVCAVSGKKLRQ